MRIVQPEELRNQQRKYCGCPMQSFKQSIDFRAPNGAHKNTEGANSLYQQFNEPMENESTNFSYYLLLE